ncbi:MAG TPA: aminoacyl-tRNA hydrolase [Acidimicrobiia bacterium]|nr:aminoacyl-tRNA hydrolase [Acidimicrobiia bacterium]
MPVICGLRNPGASYVGTRHNLGFEVVSSLARRFEAKLRRGPLRVRAELARLPGRNLILAAPLTFMNDSGRAVAGILSYFKVPATELLVVHDDIDLALGRLRLQVGGGSGGNNGIRSIESHLGHPDFARLKLGVGRPPGSREAADHVLRPFDKSEREEADLLVEDAADVAERWLQDPARAQELAAHRRPS